MPEYLIPADIADRAAQHCGIEVTDPTLRLADGSKLSRQVSLNYGKLRRAELQRNVWRFATRKAALRPIDSNTMLLSPALWSSTATYFVSQVVADGNGTLWSSLIANNTNNQPGVAFQAWVPYFGPMTVMEYDPSIAYYQGELVYTAPGDGTYNVFLSLVMGNALNPELPSLWLSTTTYFKNQVVQNFPAWSSGTTYAQGQTALYTDGNYYTSLTNGNLNNAPPTSTANWVLLPNPALVTQQVGQVNPTSIPAAIVPISQTPVGEWTITQTYSFGVFVMFKGTEYVSIANNNTGNLPNAAGSTFWAAVSGGTLYMSLIDLNYDNSPATNSPANWASGTTYAIGNVVNGSNGVTYTSKTNSNLGNDPTLDVTHTNWSAGGLTPWTTTFTQGGGNSQWMQIGGAALAAGVALTSLNITYPLGAGPLSQPSTRNVYRLPAGFLRKAPQDPKAGGISYLGAPSGLYYDDWNWEGNYIVTREVNPIVLRFVADVQDVTTWDDMFCEGLAARIARMICEPLTNSTAKHEEIEAEFERIMGDARLNNAIIVGAEEPPEDDYIACRW